jgi:hypothetical protein
MVDITYVAKRALVNDPATVLTISVGLTAYDRSTEAKKSQAVSLGGVMQSTLHSIINTWSISTTPIDPLDQSQFDEFIYSTINSEYFDILDFDDGTIRTVQRVGPHSRNRVGTSVNLFTYSFTVREVQ